MPANIRFDAFDYQKFGAMRGAVTFISPDSVPAPEAAGKAGGLYTIRVQLDQNHFGRGSDVAHVKLGLAGAADIVTEHDRLLTVFVRRIRRTIRFGSDS